MRTAALAAALAGVLVGCAGANGGPATSATRLTITAWPQGRDAGDMRRWTLRCRPAGGTLPNAARACSRLAALDRPFRPVPPDAVCTQVFGGPQEALVTGRYQGRRIWTRFSRENGCQISRWDRHRFLFPIPGGASVDR